MKLNPTLYLPFVLLSILTSTVVARPSKVLQDSCQIEAKDGLQIADVRSPAKILIEHSNVHSEAECFKACCNMPNGQCNVALFHHRGRTDICLLLDCEPFERCVWKSSPNSVVARVTHQKSVNTTLTTIPPKSANHAHSHNKLFDTKKAVPKSGGNPEKHPTSPEKLVTVGRTTPPPVNTTPGMSVMDSLRAFYEKHVNSGEKHDHGDEIPDAAGKPGVKATTKSPIKSHQHPVLPEISDQDLGHKDKAKDKLGLWDIRRLLHLGDNHDDEPLPDEHDEWNYPERHPEKHSDKHSDKHTKPKVTQGQLSDAKAAHDEFLSWNDIDKKLIGINVDSKHQLSTTTTTTHSPTTPAKTTPAITKKPIGKFEPNANQNNRDTVIRPLGVNGPEVWDPSRNRVQGPPGVHHHGHVIVGHHRAKSLMEDSLSMLVIVICSALVLLFLVLLAVCGKACMGRQPRYKPLRDYDRTGESPALSQTLLRAS